MIMKILETLPKNFQHIFIFDEFDRIESQETKAALADTIKHFSDYPGNITIVIVGVGFSIEELFGSHPSIERCCQQISMPRMSRIELAEILDDRYPQIGIRTTPSVRGMIVGLSQGLPEYVHLAGREAALSAIERRSRVIELFDYHTAIKESVRKGTRIDYNRI